MKVLVVRFSSIGDILLTSPVVRCLKEQLPDAEIHYLTKEAFATIPEANPNISKVWRLGESFGALASQLRKENFDYLIDLHHNLRTRRLSWALPTRTLRFKKLNVRKYLSVRFKTTNFLPPVHIVQRYLEAVAPLGVSDDGCGLDFTIPESTTAPKLPESFQDGYVVFAVGAQHATKRLPPAKAAQLAASIELPLVLLGSKAEFDLGEQIRMTSGALNLCGQTNLFESALLLQNSSAAVCYDSAMMHMAAALRLPSVSIWGNTVPEFGMSYYDPKMESKGHACFESVGLSCRPCSKIGKKACPRGHFRCMNDHDLSAIASAVHELSR